MNAALERHHFQISRDAEYFDRGELEKQTGQPAHAFFHVLLKELIDNALDAAESAGRAPEVKVAIIADDDRIRMTVSDNGNGIAPEVVEKILDFRTRTSDKAAYRSPTRGAQGNALKTVIGIPAALGADASEIIVEACGIRHTIAAWLDQTGQVRAEHTRDARPTAGTSTTITLPSSYWLGFAPELWACGYAVFNPHALVKIEIRASGRYRANRPEQETSVLYLPTDSEWTRFLPNEPTSPHWYTPEDFGRLVLLTADQADMPVRAFVRTFKGLSATAKAKAVCAGMDAERLSDLNGNGCAITQLHVAMCEHAAEVKPQALGIIGEEHLVDRLKVDGRHWYKRVVGTAGGVPFVVEAILAESDDPVTLTGINFAPTFADPLADVALESPEFATEGLHGFLHRCEATDADGFSLALHITCPSLRFLDRGKTRIHAPPELAEACSKALWAVCKTAFTDMKSRERDQRRAAKNAEERRRAHADTEPLKYKVFRVLPAAIEGATAGGKYPTNPRRLFYKIRPLLAVETEKDLAYSYFSQTLLTEYQEQYGNIENLYYDPRGWLYEPHAGTKTPLGTKEVNEYRFPAWQYDKILFVEKKGLWPILERARIAERYDLAIVTSEGFATVAARELFARAQRGQNYKLFVVHDCDLDGYNIARTLQEATRRLPDHNIDVIDLGLRLDQAERLNIEAEVYTRHKAPPETLELNNAERAFFIERQRGKQYVARRYELDALDPEQLLEMIETGLKKHGAEEKLIPPFPVIHAAAKEEINLALSNAIRDYIAIALDTDAMVEQALGELTRLQKLDRRAHRWVERRIAIPADAPHDQRAQSWRKALGASIGHALKKAEPTIRLAALSALKGAMEARV